MHVSFSDWRRSWSTHNASIVSDYYEMDCWKINIKATHLHRPRVECNRSCTAAINTSTSISPFVNFQLIFTCPHQHESTKLRLTADLVQITPVPSRKMTKVWQLLALARLICLANRFVLSLDQSPVEFCLTNVYALPWTVVLSASKINMHVCNWKTSHETIPWFDEIKREAGVVDTQESGWQRRREWTVSSKQKSQLDGKNKRSWTREQSIDRAAASREGDVTTSTCHKLDTYNTGSDELYPRNRPSSGPRYQGHGPTTERQAKFTGPTLI